MKLKLVENLFDNISEDEGEIGIVAPCVLCRYVYQKVKGSKAYYCKINAPDNSYRRMSHASIFIPADPKDEFGCIQFKYKIWALRKLL